MVNTTPTRASATSRSACPCPLESANKIARAERKLIVELGREPTAAEIAHATGIEPKEVKSIKGRVAELTQP